MPDVRHREGHRLMRVVPIHDRRGVVARHTQCKAPAPRGLRRRQARHQLPRHGIHRLQVPHLCAVKQSL